MSKLQVTIRPRVIRVSLQPRVRTSTVLRTGATGLPGADSIVPGPQGDPGQNGFSAYEVAVANGFVGTEAEWLASLVGTPGADGQDGQDGADSTVPGPKGDDGSDGLSAYEVAVSNGFIGTEEEWLASLVGPAGQDGSDASVTSESIANALGYTPANQATLSKSIFQGFTTTPFDTAIPTFSSGVLTLFTLRSGGLTGQIVNTVEYNYSGGVLTSKVLKQGTTTVATMTFSYSGSTLTSKVLT